MREKDGSICGSIKTIKQGSSDDACRKVEEHGVRLEERDGKAAAFCINARVVALDSGWVRRWNVDGRGTRSMLQAPSLCFTRRWE